MENKGDIASEGKWVKSLARSFLIQSAFNTERMQNIGFAYSIAPLLPNTDKPVTDALERHLEFFNTNPYMASALVGAVGKLEMEGGAAEDITDFKKSVMGAFGAIGDMLFWCSLKPLAALAGICVALSGHPVAGVITALLVFNAVHLWVRFWGFWNGYHYGRWMIYRFTKIRFAALNYMLGVIAVLLLAVMTVWGANAGVWDFSLGKTKGIHALAASAIVLVGALVVKKGVGQQAFFYIAVIGAFILSVL